MHVSHSWSFSLFSVVFLRIMSFPLKQVKIRLNLTWIYFSLNIVSPGVVRVPRNCVICCTQDTMLGYLVALMCSWLLDWIENKQPTFICYHYSWPFFSQTSINLIAHLIVHLCFHQFQIDYLDCFSHLINVFLFLYLFNACRLILCQSVRKVFVFHSIYPPWNLSVCL